MRSMFHVTNFENKIVSGGRRIGCRPTKKKKKTHLDRFKLFITAFQFCVIYNTEAYEYNSGHLALRPQVLTALCQLGTLPLKASP